MEYSREHIVETNRGNAWFADVAEALMDDFMEEMHKFCHQGVRANWERGVNLYTREDEIRLRVEREEGYACGDSILLVPSEVAGVHGLQLLVKKGLGTYCTGLYRDEMDALHALEVCRLACVAAFGIEDRRQY